MSGKEPLNEGTELDFLVKVFFGFIIQLAKVSITELLLPLWKKLWGLDPIVICIVMLCPFALMVVFFLYMSGILSVLGL